jgi:hypothetical protein
MARLLAAGMAVFCVLLLTMRQDLRLRLLENRIATLRAERLTLERELEERGRGIASRIEFVRIKPEILALRLGSASTQQVLALAQVPVVEEEKRTLPGAVLQYLSDLGEVRAAYPARRPAPAPAPVTPPESEPETEGFPETGGLW